MLSTLGCSARIDAALPSEPVAEKMTPEHSSSEATNQISTTGTVRYQKIEGGFWSIVADDGSRYDTGELPPEFQKDGMRVKFQAKKLADMMSTRMWGDMVEVTHIEVEK